MSRLVRWCVTSALAAGLVMTATVALRAPDRRPVHFWRSSDRNCRVVYSGPTGPPIAGWHLEPGWVFSSASTFYGPWEVVEEPRSLDRWIERLGFDVPQLRQFSFADWGSLDRESGRVECVAEADEFPKDAVAEPALEGTWTTVGPTDGERPTTWTLRAGGRLEVAAGGEAPPRRGRWGSIGDVLYLEAWRAGDASPDGAAVGGVETVVLDPARDGFRRRSGPRATRLR